MSFVPIGTDHVIGGVIHVQILREDTAQTVDAMFSAAINAPGITKTIPLNNAASLDFPISSGALHGTIHVQVENFMLLPGGATSSNATAISCLLVFKLVEFFSITLGSVPITASLKT
jgi:hypothetical protein